MNNSVSEKNEIKNRLKILRKEKGLSQVAFSKKVGIPLRTLQSWENGESQIKPDKAQALADHFGVSVGYLLGYENKEDVKFFASLQLIEEAYASNPNFYKEIELYLNNRADAGRSNISLFIGDAKKELFEKNLKQFLLEEIKQDEADLSQDELTQVLATREKEFYVGLSHFDFDISDFLIRYLLLSEKDRRHITSLVFSLSEYADLISKNEKQ